MCDWGSTTTSASLESNMLYVFFWVPDNLNERMTHEFKVRANF